MVAVNAGWQSEPTVGSTSGWRQRSVVVVVVVDLLMVVVLVVVVVVVRLGVGEEVIVVV